MSIAWEVRNQPNNNNVTFPERRVPIEVRCCTLEDRAAICNTCCIKKADAHHEAMQAALVVRDMLHERRMPRSACRRMNAVGNRRPSRSCAVAAASRCRGANSPSAALLCSRYRGRIAARPGRGRGYRSYLATVIGGRGSLRDRAKCPAKCRGSSTAASQPPPSAPSPRSFPSARLSPGRCGFHPIAPVSTGSSKFDGLK